MESRAKNSTLSIVAVSSVLGLVTLMALVVLRNEIANRGVDVPNTLQAAAVILSDETGTTSEHSLSPNLETQGLVSSTSLRSFHSIVFDSQVSSVPPVRLKISVIGVDAPLESVDLTPEGAVDVPKDPAHAAWFNRSPRPGEEGTAVIVGHFGWEKNIPAVFDNLVDVRAGDEVYVEDSTGAIITFVVREVRTYSHDETVPDVFVSTDGKAHLNLITCEGAWSKDEHNYSNRLIVFTDKKP